MPVELPPVKQLYWLLASASFAALVFGLSPKDPGTHAGALRELQAVEGLHITVDHTYRQVAKHLYSGLAPDVPALVRAELQRARKHPASPAVFDDDFFWVDDGELTIPEQVDALVRAVDENAVYTARVPDTAALVTGLRRVFAASTADVLNDISISCNWYNSRCETKVELAESGNPLQRPGLSQRFLIPAAKVAIPQFRFKDLLKSTNKPLPDSLLGLPNTHIVLAQLSGLALPEAIRTLSQQKGDEASSVNLFGVTLPARLAKFIIPLGLAGIALLLFSTVGDLRRIDATELRTVGSVPLFASTTLGLTIGLAIAGLLPITAAALVCIRFFQSSSVSSWASVLGTVVLVVVDVLLVRRALRVRAMIPERAASTK